MRTVTPDDGVGPTSFRVRDFKSMLYGSDGSDGMKSGSTVLGSNLLKEVRPVRVVAVAALLLI